MSRRRAIAIARQFARSPCWRPLLNRWPETARYCRRRSHWHNARPLGLAPAYILDHCRHDAGSARFRQWLGADCAIAFGPAGIGQMAEAVNRVGENKSRMPPSPAPSDQPPTRPDAAGCGHRHGAFRLSPNRPPCPLSRACAALDATLNIVSTAAASTAPGRHGLRQTPAAARLSNCRRLSNRGSIRSAI